MFDARGFFSCGVFRPPTSVYPFFRYQLAVTGTTAEPHRRSYRFVHYLRNGCRLCCRKAPTCVLIETLRHTWRRHRTARAPNARRAAGGNSTIGMGVATDAFAQRERYL